jgi:NtrC-family two-component system sensor histidine kinase KinB
VSSLQRTRIMQQELMEFIIHDLKSPLTAIQAALKTSRRHCDLSNAALDTVLRAGLSSLARLTTMISALLDVARAEDNRLQTQIATVDVGELARSAAEQLQPWATDLQVSLSVEVAADTPPALADAELTTRVLVNLLNNAIKYSPAQGTVRVTVAAGPQAEALVAIEDQGPGVPAAWLTRVFGKFEQVQARAAGAAAGTGLGLTFCRMAVQAQRGRIWMESEPGVRTVVCFTLPADHAAADGPRVDPA